jgi:predicted Zn-dependent peptidase
MGALCRSWWFEGRAIPIHEIATAIDAVTQEQILGLLKRFPLTQTLVIGAIGPRKREELIGDALTPAGS